MYIQMDSKSKTSLNLGIDLSQVVSESLSSYIKENEESIINDKLKEIVEKAVSKLKPTYITTPGRKKVIAVIKERLHKVFEDALFLAESEGQVYLVGDAGTGKTTLAKQISQALSLSFAHISCSAGMSEGHILGRMLFDGTYVPSDFVKAYENGGVFLFDEIDSADSNTLLVVNSALANGVLSVPNRKDNPTAKRHPEFICIVAGNTLGEGSADYTGRNFLDSAFLDRFTASKLLVDYDEKLEKEIMNGYKEEYETLKQFREIIKKEGLNKILSTRVFVSAKRQMDLGKTLKEVLKTYTLGWATEELTKVKHLL